MLRVFNSTFENALRIILLLDAFGTPQNTDMLYATDFIVVYGRTFGLADEDLNGDNQYKFSEFVSRRSMVQKAIKELVLDGLVIPSETTLGYPNSERNTVHHLTAIMQEHIKQLQEKLWNTRTANRNAPLFRL